MSDSAEPALSRRAALRTLGLLASVALSPSCQRALESGVDLSAPPIGDSLSVARSPLPAFAAATVWGIGVCYMYPTMLASVSERYPRGGAFFLGLMGFAGGLAVQFVLPLIGGVFDSVKLEAAGGAEVLATMSGEELAEVMRVASATSFRAVAIVPVFLLPVFGIIWWLDRRRGGYEPVRLSTESSS